MPTGGTARFASPLNVLDFVKINSIIGLDAATGRELSQVAAEIAQAETLTAHAAAAERRITVGGQDSVQTKFQVKPNTLPRCPASTDFIRRQIREMPAYEPVLPFEVLSQQLGFPPEQLVKLDANENPYGPIPAVFKALSELPYTHIYPDPESRLLRQALSNYHDMPVENILAGAGADELIDLLMRLFLDDGDIILNCPPTFGMYAFDAAIQGARVINIPRQADFSLDAASIVQAVNEHQPKTLFLTSPNNPDGRLIPPETLQTLLSLPVIVVLDEAYIEFAPPGTTAAKMVLERPNLIILRTFSKWAGLAGLRVGYGFFPTPLMPHLWKMKQPYNVSVAAATAAIVSLEHAAELEANGRKIIAERERLYQTLTAVPWLQPYPSQANFILCRVLDRPAHTVRQQLAQQGILIRYFQKPGLEDCIRISVGRPQDTDRLLQALKRMRNA
jgi:histidinol-phosphate aminotransferase